VDQAQRPGSGAGTIPLRFGVLGPATVWRGTDELSVGSGKHRRLLAALLLHANERVSRTELINLVWGRAAPKSADNLVQKYIGDLRRAFGPDGTVLLSTPRGYQLRIGPGQLDSAEFGQLIDDAQHTRTRGDLVTAEYRLDTALAMWRGMAFAEVDTELAETERARLDELRVTALQELAEITLVRGEIAAAVTALGRLTAEFPLRERLRELQMLALYRAGRQADALNVFLSVRALLADELGIEPGQRLHRLYERILRADPALYFAGDIARESNRPTCQLPPDVPDFTGRAEPLGELIETLSGAAPDGPPAIAVIVGAPGIGKSSLALHAAHLVRPRFPDGQLYLDLAGTSDAPRDPVALLAELLRALGATGAGIPDSLPERAALYRSLLAGRRMLLVLDDALDAAQVRPLLPGAACAVVITSRRLLTDLTGARHCSLDVLAPAEAEQMLGRIVGPERVAAEAGQAAVLLRSCGYLPLAIRIAGAKLAGRPSWPLQVLRERLDDQSRRLGELRVGDLGVRASFDLSRRLLPDRAAHGMWLLSLLGAQTVPGWVLGPLLDEPNADEALDVLVDSSLLRLMGTDAIGQPRYRLHDLLRTYGREIAATIPLPDRRAALSRVLAGWLDLAERATGRMPPSLLRSTRGRAARWPLPRRTSAWLIADPLRWFDAERDSLRAAVALAATWGMDEPAWELAAAAVPYYDHRSVYEDWRRGHLAALQVVRAADNRQGEAALLCGLGQLHIYRDDYEQAVVALNRARPLFQQTGDKRGEALSIALFGTVARIQERPVEALRHTQRALRIALSIGDRHFEAQLRTSIGMTRLNQGREDEAQQFFDQALTLSRELGDTHREAIVLRCQSELLDRRGESRRALDCLLLASSTFHELDDERCNAYALLAIGRIHAGRGERVAATPPLQQAASVFHRHGDRRGEAECWQLLGELDTVSAEAQAHLARALHLREAVRPEPGAREPVGLVQR